MPYTLAAYACGMRGDEYLIVMPRLQLPSVSLMAFHSRRRKQMNIAMWVAARLRMVWELSTYYQQSRTDKTYQCWHTVNISKIGTALLSMEQMRELYPLK